METFCNLGAVGVVSLSEWGLCLRFIEYAGMAGAYPQNGYFYLHVSKSLSVKAESEGEVFWLPYHAMFLCPSSELSVSLLQAGFYLFLTSVSTKPWK